MILLFKSLRDFIRQIITKYIVQIIQIVKTIFSLSYKAKSEEEVTNLRVVADHIIVKKIVIFLYSFTLKGWTNLIGINVSTKRIIITN